MITHWMLVVGYCSVFYCDTMEVGPFKTVEECYTKILDYKAENLIAPPFTMSYNDFSCEPYTSKKALKEANKKAKKESK